MSLVNFSRWFQKSPNLLVLQVVGDSLRFVLRSRQQTTTGMVNLPSQAQGRMFDVAAARAALLPQLPAVKANVAVLLPASAVHIHHLKVPANLDQEELEYQVTRHITHELGLALTDVYYDWGVLPDAQTKGQTVLIVVARQTEVVQYAQLFADTDFKMHWVCAEPLIWSEFLSQDFTQTNAAVCQVEHNGLQLFWLDEQSQIRVLTRNFDRAQMSSIGFEYVTGEHSNGVVQLPSRFVVDEIEHVLNQAHQTQLSMLHVLGAGVDWSVATTAVQSRMGLPVRVICSPDTVPDKRSVLAALWQFSEQIIKGAR